MTPVLIDRITVPRIPQHHPRETRMTLILIDQRRQLTRLQVKLGATLRACRSLEPTRQPDEQLRALGRALTDIPAPIIKVEPAGIVRRALRIVVELDEEHIELRALDHRAHVRFRDRTLRRAGDDIVMGGVLREQRAQFANQVFVILVVVVVLDVEVEPVDDVSAQGPVGALAAAVRVPEVLGELLAVGLTADGAGGVAGGDVLRELRAGLAGRAVAAEVARGDLAVAVGAQEGEDENVDALGRLAVGAEVVFRVVLAPVDDLLEAGGGGAIGAVGGGADDGGWVGGGLDCAGFGQGGKAVDGCCGGSGGRYSCERELGEVHDGMWIILLAF